MLTYVGVSTHEATVSTGEHVPHVDLAFSFTLGALFGSTCLVWDSNLEPPVNSSYFKTLFFLISLITNTQ